MITQHDLMHRIKIARQRLRKHDLGVLNLSERDRQATVQSMQSDQRLLAYLPTPGKDPC